MTELNREVAYKFIEDNLQIELENTLPKKKLVELYEAIYESIPRSSYRKADIVRELKYFVMQVKRTESLCIGLY